MTFQFCLWIWFSIFRMWLQNGGTLQKLHPCCRWENEKRAESTRNCAGCFWFSLNSLLQRLCSATPTYISLAGQSCDTNLLQGIVGEKQFLVGGGGHDHCELDPGTYYMSERRAIWSSAHHFPFRSVCQSTNLSQRFTILSLSFPFHSFCYHQPASCKSKNIAKEMFWERLYLHNLYSGKLLWLLYSVISCCFNLSWRIFIGQILS